MIWHGGNDDWQDGLAHPAFCPQKHTSKNAPLQIHRRRILDAADFAEGEGGGFAGCAVIS
jgi:hypothetical protein